MYQLCVGFRPTVVVIHIVLFTAQQLLEEL